ncbi:MAG: leucine-rich repeat domain-containing protein, partial [Gammaproteobacteria bacterium]
MNLRHPLTLIGSVILSSFYLAPLSAIPLQPGMQLVADTQLQACLDQTITAHNWTTTEEVTELICPEQGIQALDGIEQLNNLNQLILSGNQLYTTFPLDQLNQLTVLDLSQNRLFDISSLLNLYNLNHLDLGGNSRLNTWDVETVIQNNPGLTHLGVADIPLDNLSHSWLPPLGPQGEYNLVELDISRSGQYFDLFQFTQYPNLRALKAAGIQLNYTGPLDQLTQLEELDLGNNSITDLNGLQLLQGLKQLNLNGNSRLQAPDVQMLIQNNPGLTHLGVADIAMGTDLNWLPPLGPQGEFDLVELDISRTGSYIDLYPVAQYPHLKDLKAAGN